MKRPPIRGVARILVRGDLKGKDSAAPGKGVRGGGGTGGGGGGAGGRGGGGGGRSPPDLEEFCKS